MGNCSARHWFSVDPPGVYSYCIGTSCHDNGGMHVDCYGRWWKVIAVDEMPVDEQRQRLRDRYKAKP